jgi:hypothetical protein
LLYEDGTQPYERKYCEIRIFADIFGSTVEVTSSLYWTLLEHPEMREVNISLFIPLRFLKILNSQTCFFALNIREIEVFYTNMIYICRAVTI